MNDFMYCFGRAFNFYREYIMQYFSDRDIRSMPGFIGYTGWSDSIVPCKYTPRWCPRKRGGV